MSYILEIRKFGIYSKSHNEHILRFLFLALILFFRVVSVNFKTPYKFLTNVSVISFPGNHIVFNVPISMVIFFYKIVVRNHINQNRNYDTNPGNNGK